MSFTNSTPNYGLPQYIGTDKPTYLGDMNTAYSTIDTQMKANADAAAAATSTANTAASTATTASTNATTALNTANSAASEAASATSAAASATSTANTASTNASAALRASAGNTIENLAPAYDPTLTYSVGDLVTYIDENNSGKLYKCIVAVGTPEAFNINKWDDVTTSEAYAPKGVIKAQISTDGVKTWADIYKYLLSSIDVYSDLTTLKMYYINESNVMHNVFRISSADATHIAMSNIALGNHTITMDIIQYSFSSDTILETSAVIGVGGTVTFNEGSPDTIVSGSRTFYIIQ